MSVVLHQHASSADDEARLGMIRSISTVQTRDDVVALKQTQRSTPSLFGSGLIDGIPDKVLIEAEARKHPKFPEISGRVSRLKDGRLGRFGWKGQTASLGDFVLAACSNELGLEVPGHHQASLAPAKAFDPSKLRLDLDSTETGQLTEFVRSLPRPVFRPVDALSPYRGRQVFEAVSCSTCHVAALGTVDGLFSDLLLHDLGDRFSDSGMSYGGSSGPARVVDRASDSIAEAPASGEASATEWRTAPLWGVADSPPYLHDGRARTLDEAIRLHGGEAAPTSLRYTKLDRLDRADLLSFLRSLVVSAPPRKRSTAATPRHDPVFTTESGLP